MRIELAGMRACLVGDRPGILDAVAAALEHNGCAVEAAGSLPGDPVPDILILAEPLVPGEADLGARPGPLAGETGREGLDRLAGAMALRGSGRIVLLLSALAAVPARRFPAISMAAGAALLEVRTLAMRFGPHVLVNAIGCGAIADPQGRLVSGDGSMLSHVPTHQPGATEDVVNAVLFLCDPMNSYMSGQMLNVDGGWSAGYGRDF